MTLERLTELYYSSNAIGPILNVHEESAQCYNESIYTVMLYWGKQVNVLGVMLLDTNEYRVWHTTGYYAFINSRYKEAYQIRLGNGWRLDVHDLTLSPSGTALLVINGVFAVNQTTFEAPPEVEFIPDVRFQDVEVQTGEVLFEWRASDHYSFEEYYHFQPGDGKSEKKTAPDLFHVNSIEKDDLGNYLISCRMMSSIAYIDGRTGAVIWKLEGIANMFKDLSGGAATDFNGQHHARFHENGLIVSFFDNGNCPGRPVTGPTRGLTLVLDTEKMTVQLQHEYISPRQGIIQQGL